MHTASSECHCRHRWSHGRVLALRAVVLKRRRMCAACLSASFWVCVCVYRSQIVHSKSLFACTRIHFWFPAFVNSNLISIPCILVCKDAFLVCNDLFTNISSVHFFPYSMCSSIVPAVQEPPLTHEMPKNEFLEIRLFSDSHVCWKCISRSHEHVAT